MKIDQIPGTEFKIYQDREKFSYGIDAILVSSFAQGRGQALDLGTGNGIIALRMAGLKDFDYIYGVEIQEEVAQMARESVELNGLEDRVEIIQDDLKNLENHIGRSTIDTIVTNPPYMKRGSALVNKEDNFAIARHEIKCDFEDIAEISSKLLKPQGRIYIIHRPNRLVDIFYYLRKNKIEPKRIRMVQPNKNKEANLVLIEGVRDGRPDLKVEKPLVVYGDDGEYREEILKIYEMED